MPLAAFLAAFFCLAVIGYGLLLSAKPFDFLEVERFDRHGPFGLSPLVSLEMATDSRISAGFRALLSHHCQALRDLAERF